MFCWIELKRSFVKINLEVLGFISGSKFYLIPFGKTKACRRTLSGLLQVLLENSFGSLVGVGVFLRILSDLEEAS